MAYLLVLNSDNEILEMRDEDFGSLYPSDEQSVFEMVGKTIHDIETEFPCDEIFPYGGDSDVPAWINPDDNKNYLVKLIPAYRLRYVDNAIEYSVGNYPENKETVLGG